MKSYAELTTMIENPNDLDLKIKDPNSKENKMVAALGAFLHHKKIVQEKIQQSHGLLLEIRELLKLKLHLSDKTESTSHVTEDEDSKYKHRKKGLIQQLEQKYESLSAAITALEQQQIELYANYQASRTLYRDYYASETSNILTDLFQNRVNAAATRDCAEEVVNVFEERAISKADILEVIRTHIQPQPMYVDSMTEKQTTQFHKAQELKYDAGTMFQAYGKVKDVAEKFDIPISVKMSVQALESMQGLASLYLHSIKALESDYQAGNQKLDNAIKSLKNELNSIKESMQEQKTPQAQSEKPVTNRFGVPIQEPKREAEPDRPSTTPTPLSTRFTSKGS